MNTTCYSFKRNETCVKSYEIPVPCCQNCDTHSWKPAHDWKQRSKNHKEQSFTIANSVQIYKPFKTTENQAKDLHAKDEKIYSARIKNINFTNVDHWKTHAR